MKNIRAVIVEDERLGRESLERKLKTYCTQVDLVGSFATAIESLQGIQQHKPDLVFLDVLMPRLSGPDLLRALAQEGKITAKVILMSAFAGEYDLHKAKSLGADLFIPKPFDDVFAVIRAAEELVRG